MSEKNGLYAAKQPDMCRNTEKLYIILTEKVPFRFKILYGIFFKYDKWIIYACESITGEIMEDNSPKTTLKVVL